LDIDFEQHVTVGEPIPCRMCIASVEWKSNAEKIRLFVEFLVDGTAMGFSGSRRRHVEIEVK
jgi:hypothetical protein